MPQTQPDGRGVEEFPTLAAIEARAQEMLPPEMLALLSEAPQQRNRLALRHLTIEQRVLADVREVDTRTIFLDMTLPSPIVVSPMEGMSRFYPDGDVELARGATREGGMCAVAGTGPLAQIAAAATGPLMLQLHWPGDRERAAEQLAQVKAGGYRAVCLTLDALRDAQTGLTLSDIDWLCQRLSVPFGLKGIMTTHDALLAVDHGVDFLWISNDRTEDSRATIDALSEIADGVQGRVPLIVDGGFRGGPDALKALALGATLVAFGRSPLWGLTVGGAEGVQRVLRLLVEELTRSMQGAGQRTPGRLTPRSVRRIDASGFALPGVPATAHAGDPEARLMAQLSPSQRAAVRAISDDPDLSDVNKMWGITEALFGEPKHAPTA